MKWFNKSAVFFSLLYSTSLFALNPVDGFYFGLLAEVSHGPSSSEVLFREDEQLFNGNVGYSSVGGGGGLMLGYKHQNFRGEGEFLYNRISTGPVTVGTCTLQSVNIVTPTGICTPGEYDAFEAKALGYQGNSSAAIGIFNAYWDFFSYDSNSAMVPYLGAGVGFASIKNGNNYVSTATNTSHGQSHTGNGVAYQGIAGLSYYMDDFAWVSMDFRYLSASLKPVTEANLGVLPGRSYPLSMLSFTFNAAFDKISS